MKKRTFLGVILLVASGQVNAEIIDKGDFTTDTVSGLDWLDVTLTMNQSYNDVSSQFGDGGDFEGWRYATGQEFVELWFNITSVNEREDWRAEEYYLETEISIDPYIDMLGDTYQAMRDAGVIENDYECFGDFDCMIGGVEGMLSDPAIYTGDPSQERVWRALAMDRPEYALPETEYLDWTDPQYATANLDWASESFGSWLVRPTVISVAIDIKPGSDPNCLNANSHGVIPVAILGSDSFDITEIAQESLSFDGLAVRVRGNKGPLCQVDYSDGDQYLDLVCHFEDDSDNWSPGDGEATLTGSLINQVRDFAGTDSICVVP